MSRKKYVPPSKAAARVYKALLLSGFAVIPEAAMSGTRLRFDFAVPALNCYVDVQGRQHFEYVGHFYDGKDDFRAAKGRDQQKVAWCEENGQILVTLDEKEVMASAGPSELLALILQKLSQHQTESEEW